MRQPQRNSLAEQLYSLTYKYVKLHASHYCKQYKDDLADLASNIYTDFLTPKGRTHQTLLDRFDPSKSSFQTYVNTAVVRKLIDYSRTHPYTTCRISTLIEDYGDVACSNLDLIDTIPIAEDYEDEFWQRVVQLYHSLPELERNTLYNALYEDKHPLVSRLTPVIHKYNKCPIYACNSSYLTLFVPIAQRLVRFNTIDGTPQGNFTPFIIPKEDSVLHTQYTSGFSKDVFIDYNRFSIC